MFGVRGPGGVDYWGAGMHKTRRSKKRPILRVAVIAFGLTTDTFVRTRCAGTPKRRAGQCTHDHQSKHHTLTAGRYWRRELKGYDRGGRVPKGPGDDTLEGHYDTPHHVNEIRNSKCHAGISVVVRLPIGCAVGSDWEGYQTCGS